MGPFVALLPALSTAALQVLLRGEKPDADAWSSFGGQVIKVLLDERSATTETLGRIEEKIDRITAQDYEHTCRTALDVLALANRAWRHPVDRDRLLQEARLLFVRASAAAPSPATEAMAKWYLGVTWLLLASPPDARLDLGSAAGLLAAATDEMLTTPITEQEVRAQIRERPRENPLERVRRETSFARSIEREREVTTAIIENRVMAAHDRCRDIAAIQQARRCLGERPSMAPMPYIDPFQLGMPGPGVPFTDGVGASTGLERLRWKA